MNDTASNNGDSDIFAERRADPALADSLPDLEELAAEKRDESEVQVQELSGDGRTAGMAPRVRGPIKKTFGLIHYAAYRVFGIKITKEDEENLSENFVLCLEYYFGELVTTVSPPVGYLLAHLKVFLSWVLFKNGDERTAEPEPEQSDHSEDGQAPLHRAEHIRQNDITKSAPGSAFIPGQRSRGNRDR